MLYILAANDIVEPHTAGTTHHEQECHFDQTYMVLRTGTTIRRWFKPGKYIHVIPLEMTLDQLLWVLNEYNNFFNETAPMARFHYSRRAGDATVIVRKVISGLLVKHLDTVPGD
jgi:hypothetical protein